MYQLHTKCNFVQCFDIFLQIAINRFGRKNVNSFKMSICMNYKKARHFRIRNICKHILYRQVALFVIHHDVVIQVYFYFTTFTMFSGLNLAHHSLYFYAKFLLVITHRNTLQTKKKDSNVSVFYHESHKHKIPFMCILKQDSPII